MKKWRLARYIAVTALLLLGVIVLALAVSPKPDMYRHYQTASAYFAANGELLSLRLAEDQRYRLRVPLADIAPALQQATLLYEDREFYQHIGVDFTAVGRAFWQSVVRGGRRQGASTISMQLARLRFKLSSNTLSGKLQQVMYALYLEWHFSKAEILEGYFNYAPYGGNVEGAAAASLIYFGKEASRLTLPEAMALAVIPQNPGQRNPASRDGQQQLQLARQRLSQLWLSQQQALGLPATTAVRLSMPLHFNLRSELPYLAPHFVNYLSNQQAAGGRFYTSLQLDIQQQAERALSAYLRRQQDKGLSNASVLLIKRSTMQIQAWLGSADFNNDQIQGQVDGVTALRSPGSALKPFVYALALQQGLIHPKSLLTDLPRRYGSFNPENFDRQFVGPINATAALINSRNVPAVQLQALLQQPDFYQWLKQAGVSLPQPADYYGLVLALGGMELSMQQLVQLYALLGNGGQWRPLNWQNIAPNNDAPKALLSPEAAFLTLDMLRQHQKPQSGLLTELTDALPVAWKTGTSYAFRDAWAVGLSGDYVLAVWVGNFDGSSNPNLIGRSAAGPLFFSLLDLLNIPSQDNVQLFSPKASLNIRQVQLCKRSGDLPNQYCPQTDSGWFIPGVSPIKLSQVHRAVAIDKASGKRACFHQPPATELKVYEFWSSEISRSFAEAGIILKQPPPYLSACSGVMLSTRQVPKIRSPQAQLVYQLGTSAESRKIPLLATFDGDVQQAHWFADNRYLGTVKPTETLFWQAEAGRFQLRVVDDAGGVDTVWVDIADQ